MRMYNLILASQSKTRSELLRNVGIDFSVLSSQVDEDAIKCNMQSNNPKEVVMALAEAKAKVVSTEAADHLVLGADQILLFENIIFDKPKSIQAAKQQLLLLRGKVHYLCSAQSVYCNGDILWKNMQIAELKVRNFSEDFLEYYLSLMGEDVCETVGGYKMEGIGGQLFEKINGDYSTILGLPVFPLMDFLRSYGYLKV